MLIQMAENCREFGWEFKRSCMGFGDVRTRRMTPSVPAEFGVCEMDWNMAGNLSSLIISSGRMGRTLSVA